MATRLATRHSIARNLEGRDFQTATVSAMSTNNVRCTGLVHLPNDHYNNGEIFVYSGTAIGQSRRVYDCSLEVATPPTYFQINPFVAFSPQAVAADAFECHRYDGWTATEYNDAITQVHYSAEDLFLVDDIDPGMTLAEDIYEYPAPYGWRYVNRVQLARDYPQVGYSSAERTAGAGLYIASTSEKLSQAFVLDTAQWIGSYRLYLDKVASPTATFQALIYTNNAGVPDSIVGSSTSTAVAATSIGAEASYVTFVPARPIYLAAGTYHLALISSQGSLDATNYIRWWHDDASSYEDGDACAYNGSAWSAVASTTRCFWLAYPDAMANYEDLLPDEWGATTDGKIWVMNYDEGCPMRLFGQRQATAPSADTSTIELPEAYVVPRASEILLGMHAGGVYRDEKERQQWTAYWQTEANRQLAGCRTQVKPNSKALGAR